MAEAQKTGLESESVSLRIVEKVAKADGVEPAEVPSLYGFIDPDALEALVDPAPGSTGNDVRVQFSFSGYDVTVSGSGDVTVQRPSAIGAVSEES